MVFYCVSSNYHAGGNITRLVYPVESKTKPENTEEESNFSTIVNKYFDTEDEAEQHKFQLDEML